MKERIILGIDPGTNILGFALIKQEGKKLSIINIGILNLKSYDNHYLKLKKIHSSLSVLIKQYLPDEMAIESPFHGVNVQSMLKLGRAQGVAMSAALNFDIPITEYAPRKVKLAVTGTGTASKEQVASMLKKIFKLSEEIKQTDASDALAIALCHYYSLNNTIPSSGKNSWKDFIKNNPTKVRTQ
jgi:crossover junction endodeoxyribonuclease RuvC